MVASAVRLGLPLRLRHVQGVEHGADALHHVGDPAEVELRIPRVDTGLDARNETSLQAEALCKVLCHNLCVIIDAMYELGLDPGFSVEKTGDSVEKILEFRE